MSRFLQKVEELKEAAPVSTKPATKTNDTVNGLPALLSLKRKSVRQYPDNITVGLYYSDALKKYFTVTITETGSAENASQ